jgi:2-dehydro-3-deoxyphosphogluconate aldolase / (4S)-4-hydroxy-2-oxoglutarate aldolase
VFRKLQALQVVEQTGTVLIVRLPDAELAYAVAAAAVEGGIRALEITLSIPGALGVIERLASRFNGDGVMVGAGTVLDGQAAYACISAGARFLVSPQLNREMIRTANRYQVASLSGAFTPTEVLETVEAGADIVKLFPTENNGTEYAKALLAPLAHVPLMPAGGVSPENVKAWFDAGVVGVGVGSFITKAAMPGDDYSKVTRAAETFLAAVAAARS